MQTTFKATDYTIGGKLVVATVQMTAHELVECKNSNNARDSMRRMLVDQLVNHIIDNNLVEITTLTDPISDMHLIKARCYLAKDGDIKIIRTYA